MESIGVSKFKALCLEILQRVKDTGTVIVITKNGKALAQVGPPPPAKQESDAFGCMRGSIEISGNIVEPLGCEEWAVYKE